MILAALKPSPMLTRPDTPAVLAVEDRGMRAILAACDTDPLTILDGLYPPIRTPHGDLRPNIMEN